MNCENSHKKPKKIENNMECFPKYICYLGATGPMGPIGATGPMGPSGTSDTITIRNTITGEPGTNASVDDVSGSPNHILDFIIPKGFKGEDGPTGPQGIQGEIGPTGPTGPMGSISSNCYGMAHSTLTKTINNNEYVPFNTSDKISNMTIAQDGTIVLSVKGTYLINWWINISSIESTESIINFELQEISPTPRTLGWSTSGEAIDDTRVIVLYGTALVDAGFETTRRFALVNTSNIGILLNPNNEIGSVITVAKIN